MSRAASRTAALLEHVSRMAKGERAPYVRGDFTLALDTREQRVAKIALTIPIVIKALPAGDLSVVDYEDQIAIDRKSLSDFIGCLTQHRQRFGRELMKLSGYRYAAVFVEAPLRDVHAHRYRSQVPPAFIVSKAAELTTHYGVHVHFVDDLQVGTDYAIRLLRHWWEEQRRAEQIAKYADLQRTLTGGAP